ncbi:hypothetical protein IB276_11765 [Ensifer sp. ENS04]|uniref:hypothetical protein n=1 Tax=Ensifer sp. ENS04 TaxID=2769281 RepID=UPI0017824E34|nr:hypothetical protein [Ensifer sp. ENS04]MBD9540130.1 hypothetical protein [Ensifer sp. ENS04]
MTTKHDVIELFLEHPDWTSGMYARRLGCTSAYVRATLRRSGIQLSLSGRTFGGRPPERERCARIAESMGSPEIAAAIREACNA